MLASFMQGRTCHLGRSARPEALTHLREHVHMPRRQRHEEKCAKCTYWNGTKYPVNAKVSYDQNIEFIFVKRPPVSWTAIDGCLLRAQHVFRDQEHVS